MIIQLDLKSFGHIKEIANSLTFDEKETRLADDIVKDWCRIVMKEKLKDSLLMLSYESYEFILRFDVMHLI